MLHRRRDVQAQHVAVLGLGALGDVPSFEVDEPQVGQLTEAAGRAQ